MAWTSGVQIGAGTNKTSATTISTGAIAAGASVGDVLFAFVTTLNAATSAGPSTTVTSVTDTKSNTWVKVAEETSSSGVAGDGACVAIYSTQVSSALVAAADSVTAHLGSSITAKAIVVRQFTIGAGNSYAPAGVNQAGFMKPGTAFPTLTVGGLTNAEHLWIVLDGWNTSGLTYTKDANFTTIATRATTGGTASSNIQLAGGYRIATLTSSSNSSSVSSSVTGACLLAAFTETSTGPVSHPVTLSASMTSAPAAKRAAAHPLPLVSVTTSLPAFRRSALLVRSVAVALTATSAGARKYGRSLAVSVSSTVARPFQIGRALPATVGLSTLRSVQANATRAMTVTTAITNSPLNVLLRTLSTSVATAMTLVRQYQPILAITAGAAVVENIIVSAARTIAASLATTLAAVRNHTTLYQISLSLTVASSTVAGRLAGLVRSASVTPAPINGLVVPSSLLAPSTTLAPGSALGVARFVSATRQAVASVTTAAGRAMSTTLRLTAGIAAEFHKKTTGAPRIIAAIFGGSDSEASTITSADREDVPTLRGESEAATLTGNEDV